MEKASYSLTLSFLLCRVQTNGLVRLGSGGLVVTTFGRDAWHGLRGRQSLSVISSLARIRPSCFEPIHPRHDVSYMFLYRWDLTISDCVSEEIIGFLSEHRNTVPHSF